MSKDHKIPPVAEQAIAFFNMAGMGTLESDQQFAAWVDSFKDASPNEVADKANELFFWVRSILRAKVHSDEQTSAVAEPEHEKAKQKLNLFFEISRGIFPAKRFVWTILKKVDTPDPGPKHFDAARRALEQEEHDPNDITARDMLARAVTEHFHQVRCQAWGDKPPDVENAVSFGHEQINHLVRTFYENDCWTDQLPDCWTDQDQIPSEVELESTADGRQILQQDEILARYLENIGPHGKEAADVVRQRAHERIVQKEFFRDRWRFWKTWYLEQDLGFACPVLDTLAQALWLDIVQPQRREAQNKVPAVAMGIIKPISTAYSPRARKDGNALVDQYGTQLALFARPHGVAVADMTALETVLRKGAPLLSRINGHRTLTWEILQGHKQAMSGQEDARRIVIPGGWQELARLVEAGTKDKAVREVSLIVQAQTHLHFLWPDGSEGPMLTYNYNPARGQRQSQLVIILNDPLMPDYVETLQGKARTIREARRLVPVTPLPSFVGSPRTHGAQAGLYTRILMELRKRAREIPKRGGVYIPPKRLSELAAECGLSPNTATVALDCWTHDGDNGPASLELVEKNVYHLGRQHKGARRHLDNAGKSEISGQRAGQQAKRRKQKKLNPTRRRKRNKPK